MPSNLSIAEQKVAVGLAAAKYVFESLVIPSQTSQQELVIGIGTGSTSDEFTKAIAKLTSEKKIHLDVITSSATSTRLCQELGMRVLDFSARVRAAVYVDGADEILINNLWAIKGGGGALHKESLAGSFAKERIAIVDEAKIVDGLAKKFALPIELQPDSFPELQTFLNSIDAQFKVRDGKPGRYGPAITENSCFIVDANFRSGLTLEVARQIKLFPGVLSIGLFAGFFDRAFVCRANGSVDSYQAAQVPVRPYSWSE